MFRQDVERSGYLSAQDIAGSCAQVSVEAPVPVSVQAFPNPAADFVVIEWPSHAGETASLDILDLQGRTVARQAHYTLGERLQIALAPGIYFWRIGREADHIVGKLEVMR